MRRFIPYIAILLFFLCSSQMYKAAVPAPVVPTVAIGETADTTNVRLLAKDGAYISPTDKITDATSNGGNGGDVLRWNINLSIVDTSPQAIFLVNMPSTGYYCVWISYKNGSSDFQLNTSTLSTYTNATFGRLTNHPDGYSFALATNYNGTPKKFNIASTGNKKFYFRGEKGLEVDGIYIGKTSDGTSTGTCNATPSLPSGVAPLVPDYTIDSYNSITVNNSLSEDEWANSPNVSFSSNPTNNLITKFSLLWNDTANRVCGAVQVTDQKALRTDSTWYSSDHIEVVLSPGTLKTPTDSETVKYAINADCSGATPQISAYLWSGTGFLATPDSTLSASISASCAYTGSPTTDGTYTIEWCGNIPWNPAANDGINFEAAMTDSDTLGPLNAIAFGTSVNNPQQWGTAEFVSALPPSPPPDTTPPSCGTPTTANVAQTSMSLVVPTCTDYNGATPTNSAISSTFYWGKTTGYGNSATGATVAAGGSPTLTITGLDCGTTYHWKAVVTDRLGNPLDTGDQSQATAACSSYYISPTGAGTKDCTTEGNACETFAKIKTAMLNSQRQNIILLDGTYTAATTGLPDINCSGSTPWPNGTSTATITIKAKNERQALLHSVGSALAAFHIANCSYWNVEGLHGTEDDNASGGGYSIFQGDNIHNVTFKRLLADHTNRCANVYGILIESTSTNTRIEECEVYYYHRWSIGSFGDANGGQNHNIQVGNYSNSRNYVSEPVAPVNCTKPAQDIYTGGGDFGEAFYNGYQETIIDGITERAQNAGVGSPGFRSNALYGYITINSGNGANFAWDNAGYYHTNPINAQVIKDFISVGSGDGLWNRGNWMTISNITSYATNKSAGAGGDGIGIEADNNGGKSTGNVITNITNGLIFNSAGRGFVASSQNTCTLDHMNYYNNASGNGNTYSTCTHTNETTLQPTHMSLSGTDCIVYVPSNSNMKGAGVGGADIGANMSYRHDDSGNPTSVSNWCSSVSGNCLAVGQFSRCGALVTGLNDDATGATVDTEACRNVNLRLNMLASGGCPIP